jgi:hypothetical protein
MTFGKSRLRALAVGLLICIGGSAFGVYVAAHWVEQQILTPDNWVAMVSPLPKQPVVSTALGGYMSDQLFAAVPVQERIADALPPRAAFLAAPLTDQLHGLTTNTSRKFVASDGFQTIWTGANRAAMGRLVATARGQTPPLQARINQRFNINLAGSAGQLRSALGNAADAIPALQPAANKALAISADLQARPRRIRQFIRTTDFLAAILPLIATASLLTALAISAHRRRTMITIVASIAVIMLLELVALKWARQEVLGLVRQDSNLAAVSYIFDTLVVSLRQMVYIIIGIMLVVFAICLAAGNATWARSLQTFLNLDRLQQTKAMAYWRSFRTFVAHWKYYLWLAAALAVLVSLATFVAITTQTIINAVLLMLSLAAIIHIIATKPRDIVTSVTV